MRRAGCFVVCLASGALLSFAALADNLHIHGVVQAFDGNTLTIKADSGKTMRVGLVPQTRIVRSRIMSLSELKPGDHVATLSLQDTKGNLHVQSVRVLAGSPSSAEDGQYKLESNPSRIVTNGTVSAVTPASNMLSLTYYGAGGGGTPPCTGGAPAGGTGCTGSADLLIARGVPIVAVTNGDLNLLQSGAIVSVAAESDAASLLTASGVSVEREGKSSQ